MSDWIDRAIEAEAEMQRARQAMGTKPGTAEIGPSLTVSAYDTARHALAELCTPTGFVLGDVIARLVLDSGVVTPISVVAPSAEGSGTP